MNASNPKTVITSGHQTIARVIGFLYVFQMGIAIFGQMFVRDRLIVARDAVQTAANLRASETLFRLSLAGDLFVYASVIVLIWGMYVILKTIDRDAALLGVLLRLVENSVLAVTTLAGFIALRFLSGPDYLAVMNAPQVEALARVFLSMYGTGLSIGFLFLGLGSAVFGYVWLRSGYIPRYLASLGIFASLLLTAMTFVTLVFPRVFQVTGMSYMIPMFIYEVGLGLWLLIKGLEAPAAVGAASPRL